MYTLKEKKKALLQILDPYLTQKHFIKQKKSKYADPQSLEYICSKDENKIILWFHFKLKSDYHTLVPLNIHYKLVEELLFRIGKPNFDNKYFNPETDFWGTVEQEFSITYNNEFEKIDLTRVEGFRQWGELIISYMEGEGKDFIEHYSYLPNVLKEMDRLEEKGEVAYVKILVGGIDHIFRGLIISKLCNDPYHKEKIIKWDNKILIPNYNHWIPYYEKLKEELKEVKPLYNIS